MKKKVFKWHGKFYYLLGRGVDDEIYYLEQATFDCGWFWGIGYVEAFTNRKCPAQSKDIVSHNHFNSLFFKTGKNSYVAFKEFFMETPFTEKEIWEILELMRSLYTARNYADMLYIHGSHITGNTEKVKKALTSGTEYTRINDVVIPTMLERLTDILEGKGD